MISPDRSEGVFAGWPPQDLRHELSEMRKGLVRIDREPIGMSVRRFRWDEARGADISNGPGVRRRVVILGEIQFPIPGLQRGEKSTSALSQRLAQINNDEIDDINEKLFIGSDLSEAETEMIRINERAAIESSKL